MKTIDEERKAIIEDAKAAGIILGSLSGSEIFEKIVENLTKFAQLQAARNQSNNVPVAWRCNGEVSTSRRYIQDVSTQHSAPIEPLYTSPQQSNALEMAANNYDYIISYLEECVADGQLNLQGLIKDIQGYRALLTQPESTAPQQAIPSGMMIIDIEIVDDVLNKAYCDCGHSMRYERGEHLASCPLFDLNIERYKIIANQPESEGK